MNKCVLLSIRPQWCELIASGKKTIEVRKSRPKLETPFKCYIYCTQGSKHLCLMQNEGGVNLMACCNWTTALPVGGAISNGKVIGEFVCDKIDLFDSDFDERARGCAPSGSQIDSMGWNRFLTLIHESARLSDVELNEYFPESVKAYLWHISALQIYDKPKELSEFHKPEMPMGLRYEDDTIKRPPQSWAYIEELEEPCKTLN